MARGPCDEQLHSRMRVETSGVKEREKERAKGRVAWTSQPLRSSRKKAPDVWVLLCQWQIRVTALMMIPFLNRSPENGNELPSLIKVTCAYYNSSSVCSYICTLIACVISDGVFKSTYLLNCTTFFLFKYILSNYRTRAMCKIEVTYLEQISHRGRP